MVDPLHEDVDSPVKGLMHRYPDRVLFLVTDQCAMYCRHCTRRRFVGETDAPLAHEYIEAAIDYIRQNKKVRDVLISGGDPLTLSDERLEEIISKLRAIEHVEIIRIGTRAPVVLPMRITESLVNMLKKISSHLAEHALQLSQGVHRRFQEGLGHAGGRGYTFGKPNCAAQRNQRLSEDHETTRA